MSDQDPPDGGGGTGSNLRASSAAGVRHRKNKKAGKTSTSADASSDPSRETNSTLVASTATTENISNADVAPQGTPMDIVYVPSNRIILAVPKWLAFGLLFILAVVFIIGGGVIGDYVWKHYMRTDSLYSDEAVVSASIGQEAVNLFKQFDRESDGKLSLSEYEALFHTLSGSGFNVSFNFVFSNKS